MFYRLIMVCVFVLSSPLAANESNSIVIGIAGGSGSGKSTFSKKIKELFGNEAALLELDSYYKDLSHLSLEERKNVNFDHPDSLDFDLLCDHLSLLKYGEVIQKPIYDFKTHSRTLGSEDVFPAKIIIVEGVLLLAIAKVRELCDIKLFIDVEDDIRFIRRLERDTVERGRTLEEVKKQYLVTVKPMHSLFVAPSKFYADVIIPAVGDTTEAERIIASRLAF